MNNLLTCIIVNILPGDENEKKVAFFRFGKRIKFLTKTSTSLDDHFVPTNSAETA